MEPEKNSLEKGETSINHQFLGSMLVSRGVFPPNSSLNLQVPGEFARHRCRTLSIRGFRAWNS